MSTATPTPPASTLHPEAQPGNPRPLSASESLIEARIAEAASALWWAELTRWTLGLVIGLLVAGTAWLVLDHWIHSPRPIARAAFLLAGLSVAIWYVTRRIYPLLNSRVLPEYAARSLERDMPELRQALTSYVTLKQGADPAGLNGRVVRSIGATTAERLKSHNALPAEATGTMAWWIATAIALAVLVGYMIVSPKNSLQSAARLALPLASIDAPHRVDITDVVPGDTTAIAGRSVDVSANVKGLRDDETVTLRWWAKADEPPKTLELSRDSDGTPYRFAESWTLPTRASDKIPYEIVAGDATAGPFVVRVRDIPVVAVESVTHTPPAYIGKAPHTHSGGAITAIDGTDVLIRASVNRPIGRAVIEFNPRPIGETTRATAGATEMAISDSGTDLSVDFRVRGPRGRSAAVELDSYRIQVWDESDQANSDPIVYPIRVIADLPPDVAIMMPVTTPKDVPINAQQMIEVHASDPDFGLSEIRLEVRRGIELVDEPVLWRPADGASNVIGNRVAEYRFRPGPNDRGGLNLQIGDTVQVVAVAVDNRSIAGDQTAEPNVVRTDPIKLKIVASDDLPPPGDREAEGMSAPDEKPASDPSGDKSQKESGGENASPEGEPQSGGGGSGGEGAAEQKPGENQSGGESGGQSGQQSGQQNNEGGDPSSKNSPSESQSGENQPGEKSSGEGQPSGNKNPQSGKPEQDQPPGDGSESGEEPGGEAGDQQSGDQQSGDQQSGDQQSGDQQSGDQGGEPTNNPSGQSGTQPAPQDGKSGSGAKGGDQPAQPGGEQSGSEQSGGEQPSGEQSGGEGESGQQPSSPQHDGEAFERIKEHLDQKKASEGKADPSQTSAPEKNGSEQNGPKQDGSGKSQSGDQSQTPTGSDQSGGKQGERGEGSPGEAAPPEGNGAADGSGDPSSESSTANPDGKPSQQSEQADGKESNGEPADGDSGKPSDGKPSDGKSGDGTSSDGKPSNESSEGSGQGKPEKPSDAGSPSDSAKPSSSSQTPESKSPSQEKSDDSMPGTGNGQTGEGTGGDATTPRDAVDQKYAKEATDMVLDYLEQTRDQPDEQLLEKLNWSQDDLKRFQDRWKNVRDVDGAQADAPEKSTSVEDALRSLGLRNPDAAPASASPDKADGLGNIRDAGNRTPPPKAYRDAFDAFRRSMNQPRK